MSGFHTVEKIGGTSMTRFGDVMRNVIIGKRQGNELYNRIFVVSAYGGITNLLLENKKTGAPGIYGFFARRIPPNGVPRSKRPAKKCCVSTAHSRISDSTSQRRTNLSTSVSTG